MRVKTLKESAVAKGSEKALGLPELIAIALGGMIGGGIFTILGISVAMIGPYTPLAIFAGGMIAALAAYSYVKLGVYYRDEGATYGFFKRTFPSSPVAAALIGWYVIFGYIATIALYAYTFSSYALSGFEWGSNDGIRKAVACGIIAVFALVNIWSVKGMGKIEDLMVYTKVGLLSIIAVVLLMHRNTSLPQLFAQQESVFSWMNVLTVAAVTFVAYEGFQLVINAVKEMDNPDKNIPRAIYSAIALAILIYVVIALAAILAIPFADIIANEEYALAAGAGDVLGSVGSDIVILGAVLATSRDTKNQIPQIRINRGEKKQNITTKKGEESLRWGERKRTKPKQRRQFIRITSAHDSL